MSAAEDAGAACCGFCCLFGFAGLSSWCNQNTFGGRGGRNVAGCCGSCCDSSFNEDSMDKWDKDKQKLRTEKSQPASTEPMTVGPPSTTQNPPETPSNNIPAPPAALADSK